MIYPGDLEGIEAGLARRVLAAARVIAPCIDSLEPGEDRDTVLAILTAAAAEVPAAGSGRVSSQRIGPASVDYRDTDSWFSPMDQAALRSICGASSSARGPVGQFPAPAGLTNVWPERRSI